MRHFILLVISTLLSSCKSEPFQTNLANHTFQFPITQHEYISTHKAYSKQGGGKYVDSSSSVRIEWLFNPFGSMTTEVPNSRKIYGINIYLKNKAGQIDSVKSALEKKYNKPLLPMTITAINDEPHYGSTGFYCQLSPDAILCLRKATCQQGDSWCHFNSLRIAIGYGLSKAEQERFAVTYGQVWQSID